VIAIADKNVCDMKTAEGKEVAVMANQIARARHALKVQEQRFVLWIVGKIDPFAKNDSENSFTFEISVSEYAALIGRPVQGSLYKELEDVTTGLLSKVIEVAVPGKRERDKFQWLSDAKYKDGEGKVLVEVHKRMKPFLMALQREFARIPILEAVRLRSRYSIAFYQMCCSWYGSKVRSWSMNIEELREWLHIEDDEFEMVGHLKARVIDQAKEELDAKARISFRVEAVKEGRKVAGWKFKVVDNQPKQRPKGSVRLPDFAEQEETRKVSEFMARLRSRWIEATETQRQQWLDELPGQMASFAPEEGAEPRTLFLSALANLIEPELPGLDG
jgi:plasmid replication initiation protein